MAPSEGRPKWTPTIHRDTFLSLIALAAITLMLVGCASVATPVTHTPEPQPTVSGDQTADSLRQQFKDWPEAYKFAIDEDTVVRFAYPSPMIDWAGFAFIDHIPSASSVILGRPFSIVMADGTVSPGNSQNTETIAGEELVVYRHYQSEQGEARLEEVLADDALMRRILSDPGHTTTSPPVSTNPPTPAETIVPTAGPPPPELPTVPASDLPLTADESSLLRVMGNLPASFGEEGVWFADYGRAWVLAGLPPQPVTVEGFVALSDEEKDAYQSARRGLMFGPSLFLAAQQASLDWEELFGFSGFGVSLAAGTGQDSLSLFGTAYLEGDIDPEDFGQRLINLGYQVESIDGGSYYAIGEDRNIDRGSPTRRAGVMARMNRVFLADGAMAASPDTDPIVKVVAAASGDTPAISDDPTYSRLAASLANPLSAGLLPSSAVLEPQGRPHLGYDTYEKPDDWGKIHYWEALGAGYSLVNGQPWWGISLYYPDQEAAEADAGELVNRMNGYGTAITPLMFPNMSDEGLAVAAERPYVINDFCTSLTPVHASDGTGSILTVWCQMSEPPSNRWHTMMDMGDLAFLLP